MKNVVTPKGRLQWVRVTTPRLNQFNGDMEYSASIIVDEKEAAPFVEMIKEMYREEHPKKKPQSLGYKTLDDNSVSFNFKTKAKNKNGDDKKINVVDSYKKPFTHTTSIGNDTIGRLSGVAVVYANGANTGVSLYLNAVQVLDYKEYSMDDGFDIEEDYASTTEDTKETKVEEIDEFDF